MRRLAVPGVLCAALVAVASPALAVTITLNPLPEYRCGAALCKPGAATAIVPDGPGRLLASGVMSGDVYTQVTTSPTFALIAGPAGPAAEAFATGPDGNPWLVSTPLVEDVTPNGLVTRYTYTASEEPYGVPVPFGSSQGAVWIGNYATGSIDRVATSGAMTAIRVPTLEGVAGDVTAIVGGTGSSAVFADQAGAVGDVSSSGEVVLDPINDGDQFGPFREMGVWGVALAADGSIWFTEADRERIGRLNSNGELQEFVIPNHDPPGDSLFPWPRDIVAGPEGNLWFTDPGDDSIGRVTPNGEVAEYPVPSPGGASPNEIVVVGNELVFSVMNSAALGTVNPAGVPSEAPLSTPPPISEVGAIMRREITASGQGTTLRELRRLHGITQMVSAPEPGTIRLEWLSEPTQGRAAKKTGASVLLAAGEGSFNLAESKPVRVSLTKAGERLINRVRELTVMIRGTFDGMYAGPMDATKLQRLYP